MIRKILLGMACWLSLVSCVQAKTSVLVFGATWCPYCVQMDRQVWPSQAIQAKLKEQGMEVFHYDRDQSPGYFRKWGIETLPTVVIVETEEGKPTRELRRSVGGKDIQQTLRLLNVRSAVTPRPAVADRALPSR